MEREGFDMPLLIGGATTSRVHTAVKIAPELRPRPGGLRRPTPAARSAWLAAAVARARKQIYRRNRARPNTRKIRAAAAPRGEQPRDKQRSRSPEARANRFDDRLGQLHAAQAAFLGTRVFDDYDLAELVPTSTGRRSSRPGR
jgi:5-methyltetrahydrofolate--homocysteine methyltransferase